MAHMLHRKQQRSVRSDCRAIQHRFHYFFSDQWWQNGKYHFDVKLLPNSSMCRCPPSIKKLSNHILTDSSSHSTSLLPSSLCRFLLRFCLVRLKINVGALHWNSKIWVPIPCLVLFMRSQVDLLVNSWNEIIIIQNEIRRLIYTKNETSERIWPPTEQKFKNGGRANKSTHLAIGFIG